MSELLDSYTFEAKKIVYYSVTVGANSKAEARRLASNFEHCQHYEEVEYIAVSYTHLTLPTKA